MASTELAALIEREHRERIAYHSLIEARMPCGLEDAYRVQEALVERLSATFGAVRGYKVGLTSRRMQSLCGLDEPVAGRVLARRVLSSPADIALERYVHLGVESELCLLLAEDLPIASTYSAASVAPAVGGVAAAFELIDDRGADYAHLDAFTLVADNAWNEGIVLGEPGPAQALGSGALAGALWVDGRRVDHGSSADTLEHPCAVLAWLAGLLARRGAQLKAGDLVMTGSIVPTRFVRRGEHCRFELEGLPAAELCVI